MARTRVLELEAGLRNLEVGPNGLHWERNEIVVPHEMLARAAGELGGIGAGAGDEARSRTEAVRLNEMFRAVSHELTRRADPKDAGAGLRWGEWNVLMQSAVGAARSNLLFAQALHAITVAR